MRRLMLVRFGAAAVAVAIAASACGARGPLDDFIIVEASSDASVTDAAEASTVVDAALDSAPDAIVDAAPEASLLSCGTCLFDQCRDPFTTCIQSTGCRNALQCVATMCLAGGTPSAGCLFGCAADPGVALSLVAIFQCVTQICGPDCSSVLGGLLGGGGGGDAGKASFP